VGIAGIDTQTDDLHVALVELRLHPGHLAKFGGADRREILRVGKQRGSAVAQPFIKPYFAICGFGFEVRRIASDGKYHGCSILSFWGAARSGARGLRDQRRIR
jgi:hypothetical protein